MEVFTYDTRAQYDWALIVTGRLGVDFEAQPDELTIVTDELTARERAEINSARQLHTVL